MAGTKEGGKKAMLTNLKRYGKDYYRRIGRIGGKRGHTGGFAANRGLARIAGRKGGQATWTLERREKFEQRKKLEENL